MDLSDEIPVCPFCPFSVTSNAESDTYCLMQHLELCHPENGHSPFIALGDESIAEDDTGINIRRSSSDEGPSNSEDEADIYIECPLQCGETVTVTELSNHLELHAAEGIVLEEVDENAIDTGRSPRSNHNGSKLTHQPDESPPLGALGAADAKGVRKHQHHKKIKQPTFLEKLCERTGPRKRRTNKGKHLVARRLGVCRFEPLLPPCQR